MTSHTNPNSQIKAWGDIGYSVLSIWAKFHTNDGNILCIEFPNGKRRNNKKKELDLNYS